MWFKNLLFSYGYPLNGFLVFLGVMPTSRFVCELGSHSVSLIHFEIWYITKVPTTGSGGVIF